MPRVLSMKRLVIDDLRTFTVPVTAYARTLDEARRLLFAEPWDEVWLDYDMGLTMAADTLRPLILEVEALAHSGQFLPVGTFVIHTANPDGRMAMRQALSPFYVIREVLAGSYL